MTGLIEVLDGSFPPGTKLSAEDIAPFLGGRGSVPPWDLTDAIDAGDVGPAIDKLQRMLGGGDRHPAPGDGHAADALRAHAAARRCRRAQRGRGRCSCSA